MKGRRKLFVSGCFAASLVLGWFLVWVLRGGQEYSNSQHAGLFDARISSPPRVPAVRSKEGIQRVELARNRSSSGGLSDHGPEPSWEPGNPISLGGLSDADAERFGLKEDQVIVIDRLISETRYNVANLVAQGLVEVESDQETKRIFRYRSDREAAAGIEEAFVSGLAEVAGSDFAKYGAEALRSNDNLLRGGGSDLQFIFETPGISASKSFAPEGTFKMNFFHPNGEPGSGGGGVSRFVKDSYWLDFEVSTLFTK